MVYSFYKNPFFTSVLDCLNASSLTALGLLAGEASLLFSLNLFYLLQWPMNGSWIAEWRTFSCLCHMSSGVSQCKPVCCIWSYCSEPCGTVPIIAMVWQMLLLSWERRWERRTRKRRIVSILSLFFFHCVYGYLEQSNGSTIVRLNVFRLLKLYLLLNNKKQFKESINL